MVKQSTRGFDFRYKISRLNIRKIVTFTNFKIFTVKEYWA